MTKKEKLIISGTNFARKALNIDENFWILISDINHFIDINHSGLYDKENFLIRYNKSWIRKSNNERILKCSFHEVFHAFQHQELLKRKLGLKTKFTCDELNQIELEFRDEVYLNNKWEDNLVEQQAETFANELYTIFVSNNYEIDKFITKYLNLFPNLE